MNVKRSPWCTVLGSPIGKERWAPTQLVTSPIILRRVLSRGVEERNEVKHLPRCPWQTPHWVFRSWGMCIYAVKTKISLFHFHWLNQKSSIIFQSDNRLEASAATFLGVFDQGWENLHQILNLLLTRSLTRGDIFLLTCVKFTFLICASREMDKIISMISLLQDSIGLLLLRLVQC